MQTKPLPRITGLKARGLLAICAAVLALTATGPAATQDAPARKVRTVGFTAPVPAPRPPEPAADAAEPIVIEDVSAKAPAGTDPKAVGTVPVTAATAPAESEIERFCSNIADAARDRRYALQAAELKTLQDDIDKRMKALEDKRAEYEDWLKRREDFMSKAEGGVVQIYSRMRPDAAAERLAALDAELAAAILMKIDTRKAGVILNEMERKAAATLTGIMAAASQKVDPT